MGDIANGLLTELSTTGGYGTARNERRFAKFLLRGYLDGRNDTLRIPS
jgi:hypothetical protein